MTQENTTLNERTNVSYFQNEKDEQKPDHHGSAVLGAHWVRRRREDGRGARPGLRRGEGGARGFTHLRQLPSAGQAPLARL